MSDWAIKVEGLSKKYNIAHKVRNQDDTLIGAFSGSFRDLFNSSSKQTREEFWALRDIEFTVKQGDRVGIIGRNGAGKSTLLKIMSRVVMPTTGRIEYNGRMASLLEVGTGFHGELTGRENIYLNGTILGMDKREIDKKFDAIVAFSEIEQFLDTPVKRYSSGMYVRLAFAVAAHLEPEILVVDEVLAVGDSVFQKKCIDKMTDIAREGRTILFVSHSFSTISALCDRGILLEKGRLRHDAPVEEVYNIYYNTTRVNDLKFDLEHLDRYEHRQELIFREISFAEIPVPQGKPISFDIRLKTNKPGASFRELDFGVNFCDKNYSTVYHVSNRFTNTNFDHDSDERVYHFEIENNLKPGIYNLVLFLRSADVIQDFLINRVSVEIGEGNPYGYNDTAQIQGAVMPKFSISQR